MANGLVNVGLGRAEFKATEGQLRSILSKFKDAEKRVQKAMTAATNKTAKFVQGQIAKGITSEVNIKQKDVKKYIAIDRKATVARMSAVIRLSKSDRIQLIYFGAKDTKKSGVTYKISKKGPRKKIRDAFIVTTGKKADGSDSRWVTKRLTKKRLPVANPMRGPSPWGVYVISGMQKKTVADGTARLRKELKEQVRVAMLRAKGTIK